jgi:hypothetical protein
MKVRWLVIIAACALSGCGIDDAANVQAREEMMQSKPAYAYCLRANSAEPQTCVSLEQTYEADLQTYETTSARIRPGYAASSNQSSN